MHKSFRSFPRWSELVICRGGGGGGGGVGSHERLSIATFCVWPLLGAAAAAAASGSRKKEHLLRKSENISFSTQMNKNKKIEEASECGDKKNCEKYCIAGRFTVSFSGFFLTFSFNFSFTSSSSSASSSSSFFLSDLRLPRKALPNLCHPPSSPKNGVL